MLLRQGYAIRNQKGYYFLTFQIVGWIDVFTRKRYRDIIVDSFKYCRKQKELNVHGWVIMSNHVHCILSSKCAKLSDCIRDFKRHTSKMIIESITHDAESRKDWMLHQFKYYASRHKRNNIYQLWTHDNHPIELDGDMFDQRLLYIHENPVKAGWVKNAEDYVYSSARNYYTNEKGLLDVVFIE